MKILEISSAARKADGRSHSRDGVKVDFESRKQWVHLRRSNTEPIIRIYSEAQTPAEAQKIGDEVISIAERIINA